MQKHVNFIRTKKQRYTTKWQGRGYFYDNLKAAIMKTIRDYKMIVLVLATVLLFSCSTNKYKGSAADTTGTNGATNGIGKIPRSGVQNK